MFGSRTACSQKDQSRRSFFWNGNLWNVKVQVSFQMSHLKNDRWWSCRILCLFISRSLSICCSRSFSLLEFEFVWKKNSFTMFHCLSKPKLAAILWRIIRELLFQEKSLMRAGENHCSPRPRQAVAWNFVSIWAMLWRLCLYVSHIPRFSFENRNWIILSYITQLWKRNLSRLVDQVIIHLHCIRTNASFINCTGDYKDCKSNSLFLIVGPVSCLHWVSFYIRSECDTNIFMQK